jgi:hypothetical protein
MREEGGESNSSVKASPTPSIYRQQMTTVEFLNLTAKMGAKQ